MKRESPLLNYVHDGGPTSIWYMIVSEVMATSGLPYLFAGYMYSAIGYWG